MGVTGDASAAGSNLDLGSSFLYAPGGTAHWVFTGGTNYNDQNGTVDIAIGSAAGMPDPTFGVDGKVTTDFLGSFATQGYAEAVTYSNGKIIVVGQSSLTGNDVAVIRYNLDGSLDSSFGDGGHVTLDLGTYYDKATDVVVQPDGKLVLAAAGRVVRFNDDGSLDTTFGSGGIQDVGFDVVGIALELGGKIVAVGASNRGGSNSYDFAIARLNVDGTLDTAFGTGGSQTVEFGQLSAYATRVRLQSNGKIVVAGNSTQNGVTRNDLAVARLNTDGSLDNSFDADGRQTIDFGNTDDTGCRGLEIQSDGKLVISGTSHQGTLLRSDFAVARLNDDGSFDTTFDADGKRLVHFGTTEYGAVSSDSARGLALQADGRMVIVGNSNYATGGANFAAARLNSDGSLDATFGTGGIQTVGFGPSADVAYGIAVRPDGKLVLVGISHNVPERIALAQLTTDGVLDTSFGVDGKVTTGWIGYASWHDSLIGSHSVAEQEDGKIVVAGNVRDGIGVARYDAHGNLDSTFGTGGRVTLAIPANALAVSVQSDGKIIVAGSQSFIGNYTDFTIARLNSDGSLDLSFGTAGLQSFDFGSLQAGIYDMALQPNGKIVVVGFSGEGSSYDFAVARLNNDGSLDSSFGSGGKQTIGFGAESLASGVALQADGKIVVVGYAFDATSGRDFAMARLNSDGLLDMSFGIGGKTTIDFDFYDDAGTSRFGVGIQSDGKIVMVGSSFQGSNYDLALARVNQNGVLDSTFGTGGKQLIDFGSYSFFASSLVLQPDGRIVVGGYTESGSDDDGDLSRDFAAVRLTTSGNLDPTFDSDGIQTVDFGSNYEVAFGLAVQSDGRLLIAGSSPQTVFPYTIDFAIARLEGYDLSVVGTAGNDTILVSAGTLPGTLKVTVNGLDTDNIAVSGEVFIAGLGGNDTFIVTASLAGGLILAGQNGSDTYDISFGNLLGRVTVADDGASGTDLMIVRGTPGDDEIFKDSIVVTLGNPVLETVVSSGIETRQIRGGGGDDLITDPGSDTEIYGEEGNDTIIIDATYGSGVTVDGGEGTDTIILVAGNLAGPVTINNSGTSGSVNVLVIGTPQADTLVQTASGLTLNGTPINFGPGLTSVTFDGGGGNDQQVIEAAPPIPVTISTPINTVPSFTSPATFSVEENTSAVGIITATDIDLPAQQITFGIFGGADAAAFTITSQGALSFVTSPDFESPADATGDNEYEVIISADDGAGGIRTMSIVVTVLDVDENSLMFTAVGRQTYTETELQVQFTTSPSSIPVTFSVSFDSKTGGGAVNPPTNFSIDTNGVFHWTPGGGQLGQYTFVAVASNGSIQVAQQFTVTTLGVVDGVLTIVGTDGDDKIDVKPTQGDPEELTVRIKEKDYHYKLKPKKNPDNPYTGATLIEIHGFGGDDDIKINKKIEINAFLAGGAGDDRLTGGDGDDVILGGSGNDQIFGDDGNDLLIGGLGVDKIKGEKGDDILVSGELAHGLDYATLRAISQAWADSRSAAQAEACYTEIGDTLDDGDDDQLTGGSGADLFIVDFGDTLTDFKFGKPKDNKDGDIVIRNGILTT